MILEKNVIMTLITIWNPSHREYLTEATTSQLQANNQTYGYTTTESGQRAHPSPLFVQPAESCRTQRSVVSRSTKGTKAEPP